METLIHDSSPVHPLAKNRNLNYKFQPSHPLDKVYHSVSSVSILPTKTSFSLASKITTILDQGNLGACVSNAFAQYILTNTANKVLISRLYHYYTGRLLSGLSNLEDTGLYIRDACSIIASVGACPESTWPYNITQFAVMPPLPAFQGSKYFKTYSYTLIAQNLTSLQNYLMTTNTPIIFGLNVYSSFMTKTVGNTGIIPMPNKNTETLEGGHCMLLIGFNNTTQQFLCVNSWGRAWGCNATGGATGSRGFCLLPYAYILDPTLCSDFSALIFSF
jgi:C1A family cysteine protease